MKQGDTTSARPSDGHGINYAHLSSADSGESSFVHLHMFVVVCTYSYRDIQSPQSTFERSNSPRTCHMSHVHFLQFTVLTVLFISTLLYCKTVNQSREEHSTSVPTSTVLKLVPDS